MKRIFNVILISLLVSACQSTAPKVAEKELTTEQKIDKNIAYLESQISSGKREKRYDLALMYSASFDPTKRVLAKPILKQLISENNVEALMLLAELEYLGRLGYVSDTLILKHYQTFKDEKPSLIEDYENEKAEMELALKFSFPAFKDIYSEYHHFCEQPLAQNNSILERNSHTYLVIKHFSICLKQYSVNNSRQRFAAISEIEQLICDSKDTGKTCISEGYRALSSDADIVEPSFAVAAVVRGTYKNQKDLLLKKSGVQAKYPTAKTTDVVFQAFEAYKEEDFGRSSQLLIEYINSESKLSSFDIAVSQKFIANFLIARDEEGDLQLAIDYASKALNSNELAVNEHTELFELLAGMYLMNKEYSRYIDMMGNYILANQGNMDLIPAKNYSILDSTKS